MPVLNGFIGEFIILAGAFEVHWSWAAYAGLGIVLGAAYMLWLYQRTIFGELDQICKPGAVLASNTSALDINEIASATSTCETSAGSCYSWS